MSDTFLCENLECKHYIKYKTKYIRVVNEDADIPLCSYCECDMFYSYSEPADYNKSTMLMNKNEKRMK